MDVKNCRECGRLFNYLSGPRICPACRAEIEKKFQKVKEYIRENKNVPLAVIAEDNDVTVQQLKQWVREERLAFTDDSTVGIECESCGKLIRTGKFCEDCKKTMANKLENIYKKPEVSQRVKDKRESARMRFIDK